MKDKVKNKSISILHFLHVPILVYTKSIVITDAGTVDSPNNGHLGT